MGMKRILMSVALILFLMGCASATFDFENGVEMRPGERAAERLFEKGIGQPWVGGDPPSFGSSWGFTSFDRPSRIWNCWYDPFFCKGMNYCRDPCPCEDRHPFYHDCFDQNHPDCECCPNTCHSGYWWS
jgi:hypothetical protein